MFISKKAPDLPQEQKDEIEQVAYLRILKRFEDIEADRGWKSFVHNHCRGAVLDYLRFGDGFQEQRWTIAKTEQTGSKNITKIRDRISFYNDDEDEDSDMDAVLGRHGVTSDNSTSNEVEKGEVVINWDLVSRMATIDSHIHIFAKYLRGFQLEELAAIFNFSKARIGQIIEEVGRNMDDGAHNNNPWVCQSIYAFGLCEKFGMTNRDQSEVFGYIIGWNAKPTDLDCKKVVERNVAVQLSFFGG